VALLGLEADSLPTVEFADTMAATTPTSPLSNRAEKRISQGQPIEGELKAAAG